MPIVSKSWVRQPPGALGISQGQLYLFVNALWVSCALPNSIRNNGRDDPDDDDDDDDGCGSSNGEVYECLF